MFKNTLKYTSPGSLSMRTQCCEYCDNDKVRYITCLARLHGIIACPEHVPSAKRDNRAFLHGRHMVAMKDFLARFPELSDRNDIKIPRSDGSMTEGGYISAENYDEEPFVRFTENSQTWKIRVRWTEPDEPKMKEIKVSDLALSGIDTAPIIKALSDGFYTADVDARNAIIESCSAEERRKAEEAIEPEGAVRVFIPNEGIRYAALI